MTGISEISAKSFHIFTALSVLLILYVPNLSGEEADYTVLRKTDTIYTDGTISERDWHSAPVITSFVFPWHTEGEKEQTEVKLLWDNEYLYVYFRCRDSHISAHHFERNSSVSRDDCAEIFISPNVSHPLWYANYEINCIGTYLAGFNKGSDRNQGEPEGFLIGRSHRGSVNKEDDIDSYWILELAIPFHNFTEFEGRVPPQNGDSWRINLNRCGGDVNPQYSQWTASQTSRPNFHRPEDFNTILFSSKPVR